MLLKQQVEQRKEATRVVELKNKTEIKKILIGSGEEDTQALNMIDAGFDLNEAHLQQLLVRAATNRVSTLSKGRWAMPNSFSVPGVPDCTRTLKANEVMFVKGGEVITPLHAESLGLVYRAPGCHAGDLRVFKFVQNKRILETLQGIDPRRNNGLFFSVQGGQAPTDMLAGGDMDGDLYQVMLDPEMVSLFSQAPVRKEGTADKPAVEPLPKTSNERLRVLAQLVLERKYNHLLVLAKSSFSILALTDKYGADHHESVKKLVDIYYAGLDAGKTGERFVKFDELCTTTWPVWMKGRSKDPNITYVDSYSDMPGHKSIMMELYEAGKDAMSGGNSTHVVHDHDIYFNEIPENLKAESARWNASREEYKSKVKDLFRILDDESSMSIDDPRLIEARQRMKDLQEHYRDKLLEPFREKARLERSMFPPETDPPDELKQLVRLVYTLGYKAAEQQLRAQQKATDNDVEPKKPALSFVWGTVGNLLIILKKKYSSSRSSR